MAVCGGGSVVTVSDLCATNLDFRQSHVNFASMYMGLVIELVGGMFMHFSLHSYAALIYHWHTLQLYCVYWDVRMYTCMFIYMCVCTWQMY